MSCKGSRRTLPAWPMQCLGVHLLVRFHWLPFSHACSVTLTADVGSWTQLVTSIFTTFSSWSPLSRFPRGFLIHCSLFFGEQLLRLDCVEKCVQKQNWYSGSAVCVSVLHTILFVRHLWLSGYHLILLKCSLFQQSYPVVIFSLTHCCSSQWLCHLGHSHCLHWSVDQWINWSIDFCAYLGHS